MIEPKARKHVIAKLITARGEMEDALHMAVPAAQCDLPLISAAARNELAALRDSLERMIRRLEGEQ